MYLICTTIGGALRFILSNYNNLHFVFAFCFCTQSVCACVECVKEASISALLLISSPPTNTGVGVSIDYPRRIPFNTNTIVLQIVAQDLPCSEIDTWVF